MTAVEIAELAPIVAPLLIELLKAGIPLTTDLLKTIFDGISEIIKASKS